MDVVFVHDPHASWVEGAKYHRYSWHFHRRLFQRYDGLVLEPGEYAQLLEKYASRRAIFLGGHEAGLRVKVHLERKDGFGGVKTISLHLVFTRHKGRFVTALPLHDEKFERDRSGNFVKKKEPYNRRRHKEELRKLVSEQ